MKQITIDIETASDENIKDCGVYRYAESECFDLLLISYAVDNGPVATCDIANGETLPDDVRNALTDKTVIKKAFHVNFERICLSVYLRRKYPEMLDFKDSTGSYLDPVSWQCDMIHCRYLGMLSSLDDMGRLLRLKEKKMAEGKELIRFFCTLHQEADGSILFHDKSDAPKKWEKFKAYNRRDVEVELKIQRYLSEFPVPEFVWEEFYIDQEINDRGILVDTSFAKKAVELDRQVKKALLPKLKELTELDNPNSPVQMKEWLMCGALKRIHWTKSSCRKFPDQLRRKYRKCFAYISSFLSLPFRNIPRCFVSFVQMVVQEECSASMVPTAPADLQDG